MANYRDTDADDLDSALGTLSMRDKSLLKRSINRHHNNNISAGYVPVHGGALERTGLRGRKTYLFWSVVGLLCLLAWANMIITLVIFRVLRLGGGLESLELLPAEDSVKFLGSADLGALYKPDGSLEGFGGEGLSIGGPLSLETSDGKGRPGAALSLAHNGTAVRGVTSLRVAPLSGPPVFSTKDPSFRLPGGVRNAHARMARTTRVSSPVDQKLVLKSESFAKLRGSEGTRVEGKEIVWSADQVVTLRSSNGSIVLGGKEGITLDVKSIPIVGGPGSPLAAQYKVCVCMPQGRLFRVPVSTDYSSQIACHNIDQSKLNNPCM